MKRKNIILLVLISIFTITNVYATELTTNQKAILEVGKAYYRKNNKIQYCSFRRNDNFAPEDATDQSEKYMVCSGFTYNTYREALGLIIPRTTATLTAAAYNNQDENDIIFIKSKTEIENELKPDDTTTLDEKINTFIRKMYSQYNLQEGDLIVLLRETSGHVIMAAEDIQTSGEKTDTVIYHSTSTYEKVSNKITKGLSYNDNGTVQQTTLSASLKSFYNSGEYAYLTLYRPLALENGKYNEYTCTLNSSGLDSYNPTNYTCTKELKNYTIKDSTNDRIKYPEIDIDKSISSRYKNIINESNVELDDELTYTIKIKNNSSTAYPSMKVTEYISDLVEITNSGGGTVTNNKIEWNIDTINPSETKEIVYRVIVKKKSKNQNKIITSKGNVENITTATITNKITKDLSEEDENKITTAYANLESNSSLTGIAFINKVYTDANLDLDFKLDDFDITSVINKTNGTAYTTINIDENNKYSKYILNNYYGGLYQSPSTNTIYLKYWANSGTDEYSTRATKIYKEHLKTGDILIYKNENDSITKEDGTYAYIYVNGSFYGKNKLSDNTDKNEFSTTSFIESGKSTNTKSPYLTTLLGKDYYVILRPSLEKKYDATVDSLDDPPEEVETEDTLMKASVIWIIIGTTLVLVGTSIVIITRKKVINK